MTYGSLFSGAGLGDFGFELAGFQCKWQIENDKYCRKILELRWPKVKRYGDIKKVKTDKLEKVDLVTGGFPCQPFSVAGKRVGEDDDRNLWPEMFRVVKDIEPRWVVAENVPGIIPLYLDTVLSDLESEGYECWPIVFSAHSLGARHKRERLWIVGHAESYNRGLSNKQRKEDFKFKRASKIMANTVSDSKRSGARARISGQSSKEQNNRHKIRSNLTRCSSPFRWHWKSEPSLGRVVNGCANRVDRLKALGNGQTPCSTFLIGECIKKIEEGRRIC